MFGLKKDDRDHRKRVCWGFSSLDYKNIEAYLEKKAREGWMLEVVDHLWATFRKTEPQSLLFTVDILEKPSNEIDERRISFQEYRELCEKSGWNFVTSMGQLQIFYGHEEDHLTPLQTDDELEENLVKKHIWLKEFSTALLWLVIIAAIVIGRTSFVMEALRDPMIL